MTPPVPSPENRAGRDAAADDAAATALDWMRRTRAEDELLLEVASQVRRRRRRRSTLTGGVALALIMAGLWSPLIRERNEVPSASSASAASPVTAIVSTPERRELPDGSVAELKPGAELVIDYASQVRRVRLRRGEAHFQVAKDVNRPFVVVAGGVEVRAVGTAFAVQLGESAVEVLVTEGRVAVERPTAANVAANETAPAGEAIDPSRGVAAASVPLATVDAGHRVVVDVALESRAPRVEPVPEAELSNRLAWRIPQLEFSRTPLPQVVALMNAHAARGPRPQFVIADRKLHDIALSGFLRADNTEGLVRLLETNFGVGAERDGTAIVLRKAQ